MWELYQYIYYRFFKYAETHTKDPSWGAVFRLSATEELNLVLIIFILDIYEIIDFTFYPLIGIIFGVLIALNSYLFRDKISKQIIEKFDTKLHENEHQQKSKNLVVKIYFLCSFVLFALSGFMGTLHNEQANLRLYKDSLDRSGYKRQYIEPAIRLTPGQRWMQQQHNRRLNNDSIKE